MGLSTKQVSSDGLDWSQSLLQAQTLELPKPAPARRQQQQQQQNQQQQPEPLKCPRCDSTNTKFCYYNNYNKSQPRHFCRACKRHWTKGGTLRNVPVGGGRKNKRQKKPAASASASTSTSTGNSPSASAAVASTTNSNISNRLNNMAIQAQQQRQNLPVSLGEQRCVPEFLYQSLLRPPSAMTHKNFLNSGNLDSRTFGSNNRISSLPFPLDQNLQVPFSTSSPFNTNPFSASASLPPPNGYNYSEEFKTMEEPTITGILGNPSSTTTQPWQIPATTTGMDTNTYWSWDEIDTFASTDLNLPWDDSETKP